MQKHSWCVCKEGLKEVNYLSEAYELQSQTWACMPAPTLICSVTWKSCLISITLSVFLSVKCVCFTGLLCKLTETMHLNLWAHLEPQQLFVFISFLFRCCKLLSMFKAPLWASFWCFHSHFSVEARLHAMAFCPVTVQVRSVPGGPGVVVFDEGGIRVLETPRVPETATMK